MACMACVPTYMYNFEQRGILLLYYPVFSIEVVLCMRRAELEDAQSSKSIE